MISGEESVHEPFYWRRLIQYFFQGVLIIAPIAVTIYVVLWLFNAVDGILPGIIHYFFPYLIKRTQDGELQKIPGLGFLVVVLLLILIGRISSSFLVSRIVEVLDTALERTPGVKYIYTSVKDLLEAFGGNRKKFDNPVLVHIDAQLVWRIGFITSEDAKHFGLIDHVVVYVPQSYAISGIVYIVPKENIKFLHHISGGEAMKFVISGGVSHVEPTVV